MTDLTERQLEVYRFICSYRLEKGFSPSFSEIGKALYMSKTSVARHINILLKKSYIDYVPKTCRSIIIK